MHVAVSMTNHCEYRLTLYSAAVLRLTQNDRAVAEIAALAEHVASLTAAAAAFQLRPDVPLESGDSDSASLIPLVDEADATDAAETLGQIHDWARQVLGINHVPAVWRALAHHPRLLEAAWRKDRLVLAAGTLDELVKGCVALAVAQFRQSALIKGPGAAGQHDPPSIVAVLAFARFHRCA
jgi:hypothetical protein